MVSIPVRIRPLIILFGDSITQQGFGWTDTSPGWAALLSRDYSRRADVLNRGFSGYNTRMALDLLPNIVGSSSTGQQQTNILFATVFFGANDAALPGELQHIPPDEYSNNLISIVEHMKKSTLQVSVGDDNSKDVESCSSDDDDLPIILFTPPPVDADAWYAHRGEPKDKKRINDRANENAKLYGDIVKDVAKKANCSVLDVFDCLGGNGPVETYGKHLRDGLHLSASGNVLVYEGLMEVLGKDHPHLLPMIDGSGKYGKSGIPLEEKLWGELC
uniref:SGNH hydrolase-type esterase domain-containing protein n=1 Tax=Ditylum brightwellii TaxID=49249 RepID=A0A7S1ZD82_9STRA|mmetsp:Transcript_29530/g.43954  ORF Transcript_29530/g.43954 Transcript_29530/m.43954 type:complete len:274 (+) Transcript_29530:73-894(+)